MAHLIGPAEVGQAARRLAGVVEVTPVFSSRTLSGLAGRTLRLKAENLQRTGSFKIRGAYNRIAALAGSSAASVVAASAGNHAQGVALAARLVGLPATVFMPVNAALPKVEATRSYGAEVRLEGSTVDDCIRCALDRARSVPGAVFVPPFDDPDIVAGQATVGLELIEQAPDQEVVVVPVGGGGLVAGVGAALAGRTPHVTVVGAEPEGAASMRAALDAGRPVALGRMSTIADGVAVRSVSELTLEHARAYVDDVVAVPDEAISRAMLLLLERAKLLVEPAGALALAAVLEGRVPGNGPVTVILSGGNVDPLLLTRLIDHGLSAAGRYMRVRAVLLDHPGALAGFTATLAELGLNVIDVAHHRSGFTGGRPDEVEVQVTVETRDPAHQQDALVELRGRGFEVTAT